MRLTDLNCQVPEIDDFISSLVEMKLECRPHSTGWIISDSIYLEPIFMCENETHKEIIHVDADKKGYTLESNENENDDKVVQFDGEIKPGICFGPILVSEVFPEGYFAAAEQYFSIENDNEKRELAAVIFGGVCVNRIVLEESAEQTGWPDAFRVNLDKLDAVPESLMIRSH